MMSYTCNFKCTLHEISNLRIRKDIVRNALISSLRVFKNLFTYSERTSLRIINECVKIKANVYVSAWNNEDWFLRCSCITLSTQTTRLF